MPRGATPKVIDRESRMTYTAIRLFLQKGYSQTTTSNIAEAAGMAVSAFFAVFPNKESLLMKLTRLMHERQFARTDELLRARYGEDYDPLLYYALEPSLQLYIAESTEALRDLYVSSYSIPNTAEYICQVVADKLAELLKDVTPRHSRQDLYELEIGGAGLTRNYMAKRCDRSFTMDKKLRRYLNSHMMILGVDEEKRQWAINEVLSMDLKAEAERLVAEVIANAEAEYQAIVDKYDKPGKNA